VTIIEKLTAKGKLWLYDISIDEPREATQADIERLVFSEQAFGATIMAIREIVKRRAELSPEERMKLMRNFLAAIDGVSQSQENGPAAQTVDYSEGCYVR